MHQSSLDSRQHSHTFGQDLRRPGERRTIIVIVITGVMMIVEIVAGILFGSMALLADGVKATPILPLRGHPDSRIT